MAIGLEVQITLVICRTVWTCPESDMCRGKGRVVVCRVIDCCFRPKQQDTDSLLHVMLLQCDLSTYPIDQVTEQGHLPVAALLPTTAHPPASRHAPRKWLLACGHIYSNPHQLPPNDLIHQTSAKKSTRHRYHADWQADHQSTWWKVRWTGFKRKLSS